MSGRFAATIDYLNIWVIWLLKQGVQGDFSPVGREIFRNDSVMAYYEHLPFKKKPWKRLYAENLMLSAV
jgi:hypothetical protein